MLLADVVATSAVVTATRSRNAKIAALADLLARTRAEGDEVEIAVGLLTGIPRQGRIGVGWATLASIPVAAASAPTITLRELDDTVVAVGATAGTGSEAARRARLEALLARATEPEAEFVRALFTGGLRQGALEGLMLDAIARAAEVDG